MKMQQLAASFDAARSARPEEVAIPSTMLADIERRHSGVWSALEQLKTHVRGPAGGVRPWCDMPVLCALQFLNRRGVDVSDPMASHEAARLAGFYSWRHRKAVYLLDRTVWGDRPPSEEGPLPARELLLQVPPMYLVTSGLEILGQECAGVLAYLDDDLDGAYPELQLVCMLRGMPGSGAHPTPMTMRLPLPDADLREAYLALQNRQLKSSPGFEELQAMIGPMLDIRKEILSRPDATPEMLSGMSALTIEGFMVEQHETTFAAVRKVARLLVMPLSGEFEVSTAAALDSPLGHVQVIGVKRPASSSRPDASPLRATPKAAARDDRAAPSWIYGADVVGVPSLIQRHPAAADAARELFLAPSDAAGVTLPPGTFAAAHFQANTAQLFPGLRLEIVGPSGYAAACRAHGDRSRAADSDSLYVLPKRDGDPHHAVILATDDGATYVSAERAVHVLGQYVLSRAAKIKPGMFDPNRVEWAMQVMGLVWSLGRVRAQHAGANSPPWPLTMRVAAYFAGYALCHFLQLDPRTASFGLLQEEAHNPTLVGMVRAFMDDLRYVVGMAPALDAFLTKRLGISRQQWLQADENFRCDACAKAVSSLLSYQDTPAAPGSLGVEGGVKWVPSATIEAGRHHGDQLADALPILEELYRSFEEPILRALKLGQHPTILMAMNPGREAAGMFSEPFVPHGSPESERRFIDESLARPECLAVIRLSEVWMEAMGGKRNGEGVAVKFLGRGRTYTGVYRITRAPLRLQRLPLRAEA